VDETFSAISSRDPHPRGEIGHESMQSVPQSLTWETAGME